MIALLQILALVFGLGGGVHAMGASNTAPHHSVGPWFSTVSRGVHTEGAQPTNHGGHLSNGGGW